MTPCQPLPSRLIGALIQAGIRLWVRVLGRTVKAGEAPWLDGPAGGPGRIGAAVYDEYIQAHDLEALANVPNSGLMRDFDQLESSVFPAGQVDARVRDFYERTVCHRLEAWSQWSELFRPFGWILVSFVSRQIEQLNLPLSPLDTSRGMKSDVIQLVDRETGEIRYAGWLRRMLGSGTVTYAGFYSVCRPANYPHPCVKVVFPLPRGSATVILRPERLPDGSLNLVSAGKCFGDPGFYRVLQIDEHTRRVRYIRAMQETTHVYVDEEGVLRTDHVFRMWGLPVLTLHYKIMKLEPAAPAAEHAAPGVVE